MNEQNDFSVYTFEPLALKSTFSNIWNAASRLLSSLVSIWLIIGFVPSCPSILRNCRNSELHTNKHTYLTHDWPRKTKSYSDMDLVQNFTPPDFQAKNFTPSISPDFNSFSKKKTRKMSENGEIYTAGKNFTLPPAATAWTNSTSVITPFELLYLTLQRKQGKI